MTAASNSEARKRQQERDELAPELETVARRVIDDVCDPLGIGDLWENYPEIGEHDWNRVVDQVRKIITERVRPTPETLYEAAYQRLADRAEDL